MSAAVKSCSVCKLSLPVEQFHKNRANKDGLFSQCRICKGEKRKSVSYPPQISGVKSCSKCKTDLPVDQFQRDCRSLTGLNSWCKKCVTLIKNPRRRRPPGTREKTCCACKKKLPGSAFHLRSGGLGGYCKVCEENFTNDGRLKSYDDPTQERYYRSNLRRRLIHFGISLDEYVELVKKGCAICKGPPKGRGDRYYFDHDHKTGKFRGLLCSWCNSALGYLRDDIERFKQAIVYLEIAQQRYLKAV